MKTKRNRWLFGIALVGGVLALLFLHSFLQPVPSYAGKDAGFWFDAYSQPPFSVPGKIPPGDPVQAFRDMGAAAAPFLVRQLRQSDSWEKWYAIHRSGWPAWVKQILPVEKDWSGRRASAARLLAQLGPDATNAVPQLVSYYAKLQARKAANAPTVYTIRVGGSTAFPKYRFYSDDSDRILILQVLGAAGKNNPEALNTLAGALQEREMADTAILAIVKLAEQDGRVVPRLVDELNSTNNPARLGAAEALGILGKQDKRVVPRLVDELNSTNNLARSGAAEALGLVGPQAHSAIIRLKELVEESKETDGEVRFKAADALGKIDRQAYVPFRIKELKSPSEGVRWNAAASLAEYGTQSKPAIPALVEALKDTNNRVRGQVAIALGQIGPAAKEAAPALREALKDEYSNVREAAAEALKKVESAEVP